jgi:Phosducin
MFYSKKRMAEISTLQKASVYNQVYPLQKTDYAREVTEASSNAHVLVHLTSSMGGNTETRVLSEIWRQLAAKYGEIKFCEIRADMCIEGYPERNTPTILAYKDGEIGRQFVTLRELKGVRTKAEDVEKVLVELGAVKEGDLRMRKRSESDDEDDAGNRREVDDDDDDWD